VWLCVCMCVSVCVSECVCVCVNSINFLSHPVPHKAGIPER
jgi:hypothetical protein